MKYRFSAEFLKILPPDNSFGDAWESLCFDLLSEEHGIKCLQRLKAPDGGIDILNRKKEITAIQCKSHKYEAIGTISPNESIKSLKSAIISRKGLFVEECEALILAQSDEVYCWSQHEAHGD